MLKVYRLLRNNQETGPYSLEELLQLNLKPLDLVWVEGKSGCWAYPYEVDTLKAHVPPPPAPSRPRNAGSVPQHGPAQEHRPLPEHVFVSLPSPRTQAAPARQVVNEPLRQAAADHPADAPRTVYTRSLDDAEEAYTNWVYTQKAKKKPHLRRYAPPILLTAGIAAAGYFGLQQSGGLQQAPQLQQSPETRPTSTAAWQTTEPPADTTVQILSDPESPVATVPKVSELVTPKPENQAVGIKKATEPGQETPVAMVPVSEQSQPVQTPPTPSASQPETTAVESPAATQKKRGFLGGLFRKKDKEAPPQEAPAATRSAGTDETIRKARRREENSRTAPQPDIADRIELRSNLPQEDWMMGVVGRKLTLHNHGEEQVKTATVEVRYLSEDNELLDKKTILFTNVAPKGKATIAIPDHKMASKATFQVLSAAGAGE